MRAIVVFGVLLVAACAQRIKSAGPYLVDEHGRVRVFHGFNDVQEAKGRGSTPGGPQYLPHLLMNETMVATLEAMGFNAFRLPMMWAGACPDEDVVDHAYLDAMLGVVRLLKKHNMHSLLDMHQDVLSSLLGSYDGAPQWVVQRTTARKQYPWPFKKLIAWGEGYLTEATGQSFQDIYDNVHGGMTAWETFWEAIASHFSSETNVLGYELINEPWPGDIFNHATLLLPGTAGSHTLQPAYEKLSAAIRQHDNDTLVFFEPVTWGMLFPGHGVASSGFTQVPGGSEYRDRTVFSFHYYCWLAGPPGAPFTSLKKTACDRAMGPMVYSTVKKDMDSLGVPSFMTEFGAMTPDATHPELTETAEIEFVLDLADEHFTSWSYWDLESVLTADRQISEKAIAPFIRPFAQAIAGTPVSTRYQATTRMFALSYVCRDLPAPTEVFLPAAVYADGYSVTIRPAGVMQWAAVEGRSGVIALTPVGQCDGVAVSLEVLPA